MYSPEWKGPIEGYVTNQLPKVLWRLSRTHDRDDAMQEAKLVFWRCSLKYPALDEPKHFMALFKTAWSRRVHELSTKSTRTVTSMHDWEPEEDVREPTAVGDLENDGFLRTLVRQAPREVMMVLNLFLNAPAELLGLAEQAFHDSTKGEARFDQNAMVRRLLGSAAGERPVDAVKAYFLGE